MVSITLPKPDTVGTVPLEVCISKRRSIRRYIDEPLTRVQLSQLLWAGQGITDLSRGLRAAPSAGATYPAELYAVTYEGVYHYLCHDHSLELHHEGDIRPALCKACLGQGFVSQAPLSVVIGMIPSRTTGRYGARGLNYIGYEAGHIAQNLHLQAISLGLDSVPVGAYNDNAVADAVHLPKDTEPTYIVCIGKPG